jgi:mRNA interferase MazF
MSPLPKPPPVQPPIQPPMRPMAGQPRRFEPWQVWWVDFDPQFGTEQAGQRPAIVVGSQMMLDANRRLVQVVPCTHTDRGLTVHPKVVLDGDPGFAMCEQVKALDVGRVKNRHKAGRIADAEIEEIRFVLRQVLDIG